MNQVLSFVLYMCTLIKGKKKHLFNNITNQVLYLINKYTSKIHIIIIILLFEVYIELKHAKYLLSTSQVWGHKKLLLHIFAKYKEA